MKKKIYLSAPLSAGNLKNHIGRFLRYAGYTMKEGVIPVAVHFYVFGETDDLQADSAARISFEERFSLIWVCDSARSSHRIWSGKLSFAKTSV